MHKAGRLSSGKATSTFANCIATCLRNSIEARSRLIALLDTKLDGLVEFEEHN
jgi:hypothetical protein